MKKLTFLIIVWLVAISAHAQTLPGINYQVLLRNSNGQTVTNQPIGLEASILHGLDSVEVYKETHNTTTNAFGQVNLTIGEGEVIFGSFNAINWGNGPYFLKTGVDLIGSGTFQELEVVKFYSVPYSYHSNTANVAITANVANVAGSIPSMTYTERDAIENPTIGMQIFNTISGCVNYFNGDYWIENCGEKVSFQQCGDLLIDYRDGQKYRTVQIGTQCWMAENLNVGIRIDGIENQSNNGIIEKYCYDNTEANCDIYGGLYQWDEMMGYTTTAGVQGICPETWHLPTDADWTTLTTFLGGETVAGGKMKEAGTTHWNSPNTGATNSSGFTGLPGGYRSTDYTFYSLSLTGAFWSSFEISATGAWYRYLFYYNASVDRGNYGKGYGLSVRCLRD